MSQLSIKIPPGINVDDTTYSTGMSAWSDAGQVRFWRGLPQTIGGWESIITNLLTGVCRTAFPWTDNGGNLLIAFGTNSNLEVTVGGELADITPDARLGYAFVPITGGSGYTAPVLTFPASGGGRLATGVVILDGGVPLGIQITDPGLYVVGTPLVAPTLTDPNGTGAVIGTPIAAQYLSGNVDGTGGDGWGTGAYGVGEWGEPSDELDYPATWTLSAYGQSLIANPRGGGIYQWNNDPTVLATLVPSAPPNATCALVMRTRQIMAFGCNDETTGIFNPLTIRFSDLEDITDWITQVTNNAGQYTLSDGGRIVSARLIGQYVLVWTDNALYLATYTADVNEPWEFDRIGDKCGLIGPNACCVVDQRAYWFTPSGQFYAYQLGGSPALLISPLVADLFDNISDSQQDKIVMSSCVEFAEIRLDYPDGRDGTENSRYVAFCTVDGSWTRGTLARTAYTDANPSPYPVGVTVDGHCYFHERGQSADGGAFSAFVESAAMYLDSNPSAVMRVRGMWPDVQTQVGGVNLTVFTRMYPQAIERNRGAMPLAPGQSKKDFQAPDGRISRLRFDSMSAPTFWRLGKPVFDVFQTGQQ